MYQHRRYSREGRTEKEKKKNDQKRQKEMKKCTRGGFSRGQKLGRSVESSRKLLAKLFSAKSGVRGRLYENSCWCQTQTEVDNRGVQEIRDRDEGSWSSVALQVERVVLVETLKYGNKCKG